MATKAATLRVRVWLSAFRAISKLTASRLPMRSEYESRTSSAAVPGLLSSTFWRSSFSPLNPAWAFWAWR